MCICVCVCSVMFRRVNAFACDPRGLHIEIVVEQHKIGVRPKVEGAFAGVNIQTLGRMEGGRFQGVFNGAAYNVTTKPNYL